MHPPSLVAIPVAIIWFSQKDITLQNSIVLITLKWLKWRFSCWIIFNMKKVILIAFPSFPGGGILESVNTILLCSLITWPAPVASGPSGVSREMGRAPFALARQKIRKSNYSRVWFVYSPNPTLFCICRHYCTKTFLTTINSFQSVLVDTPNLVNSRYPRRFPNP